MHDDGHSPPREAGGSMALEASEARLRELAEHMREVLWVTGRDPSDVLYVSPAYEQVWGRPIEEARSARWIETIHPDDRDRVAAELAERYGREPYELEYRVLRPDGEARWVHARGAPVHDEHGEVRRVVGIAEDVTEWKERELEMRFLAEAGRALSSSLDYEETLRRVAQLAVPEIADWCAVDVLEQGELRRLAAAHVDPARQELAREVGRRWPTRLGAEAGVARVIRTGEPELLPEIPEETLRAATRDEEHLRIILELGLRSAMLVPLVARERVLGAITFIAAESGRRYGPDDLAFAQEVAARAALAIDNARLFREVELARRDADRRAREETALRRATEAVSAMFSVEGVIAQIAESALTATDADGAFVERIVAERQRVEVVARAGRLAPEIGETLDYGGSYAQRVIERGAPILLEDLARAESPLPAAFARRCAGCTAIFIPLLDAGEAIGTLAIVRAGDRPRLREDEVARAVTFGNLAALAFRKIHLLEDSERRREELQRVMESRTRLMRGFSHDVKNPLGAADGYLALLEDGVFGELAERQRSSIVRSRASIRDALELIDSLVELARAEAGQVRIERQPVDVREIARELTEDYRAQPVAEGLDVGIDCPDVFPVVRTDASRVRQVLGNLISNAVKYTPDGGSVRVRVSLRPGGGEAGERVAIDVADTGPGIPPDKRDEIFREFTRLHGDEVQGAGLGLAISQRVAQALGGEITLESEVGRGSTFTLWLPLDQVG